jgi:hypothetical protein
MAVNDIARGNERCQMKEIVVVDIETSGFQRQGTSSSQDQIIQRHIMR